MLKSILISVVALIFGAIITVYGVFLSVFADGNLTERLILIGAVLLILFVLSLFFTYIQPQKALLNSAFLGSGGIIVLLIYRQNIYYFLYSLMILLVCLAGVYIGRKLNVRYRNKSINNMK
jgi:integral membrane sensor domain MASE1